jgi:hypothetical protein
VNRDHQPPSGRHQSQKEIWQLLSEQQTLEKWQQVSPPQHWLPKAQQPLPQQNSSEPQHSVSPFVKTQHDSLLAQQLESIGSVGLRQQFAKLSSQQPHSVHTSTSVQQGTTYPTRWFAGQ